MRKTGRNKKNQKRALALLMAGAMLFGNAFSAMAAEPLPTAWDLTEIYQSADAWEQDFARAEALTPALANYRGTLGTAQGLYQYLEETGNGELSKLMNRLTLYSYLGYSLNPSDPVSSSQQARLSQLSSKQSTLLAYVTPELYALPLETRQAILADPLLKEYAYSLENLADPDYKPKNEETNTVLAKLSPAAGAAASVYETFSYVDLPHPYVTMPDGTVQRLTEELYTDITKSSAYTREFKKQVNELILTRPIPYKNTFAALLGKAMLENWCSAQTADREYESTRACALEGNDIDPKIYDMLIAAARKGAPDWQRQLNLHKQGLGLEEQYGFDLNAYVSSYQPGKVSYEDGIAEVRQALSVLGEDYLQDFDVLTQSAHQDAYPTDTKTTGAFSVAIGNEFAPFALFNYNGYSNDVSTLAHELGHSIYSYESLKNQKPVNADPTIFTQEVASTTNELIYYNYKMNHAQNDEEKLFYLENALTMFSETFFVQTMYAEFEDSLYQTIESDGTLDAETVSQQWADLFQQYRGDSVTFLPDGRYNWTLIPHFYYNYYVYQYATSVSYAAAISQKILSGDQQALNSYKTMLKLGNSMRPDELLKVAGIDPLSEATYEGALNYYRGMVDEYQRLIEARAK